MRQELQQQEALARQETEDAQTCLTWWMVALALFVFLTGGLLTLGILRHTTKLFRREDAEEQEDSYENVP